MADIEMDLDPSRVGGHDDHIDEDLIEYDLDADAMDGNDNEWTAEDLEIQDVDDRHTETDMDAHVHMETLPDGSIEQNADAMDTLDALPFSHDADMASDLGNDEKLDNQEEIKIDEESASIEDLVGDITTTDVDTSINDGLQTHTMPDENAQGYEQVEEIDFGAVPDEEGADDGVTLTETKDTIDGHEIHVPANTATDVTAVTEETAIPAVEEELTWEEDDEEAATGSQAAHDGKQATASEHEDTNVAIGQTEQLIQLNEGEEEDRGQDEDGVAAESVVDGKQGDDISVQADLQEASKATENPEPEAGQEQNAPTRESAESVQEGPDDVQEEARTDAQDRVPAEPEEQSQNEPREETSYPPITVQYKGEEFPCFAASDGFFTSTSVLEESIETLLGWFRAELAAELAADEELVFHIDELGLEFAESTQHDVLSGTTLQYVLEIHDMLVQNQDHDDDPGAKGMYTYLFTRTSTSKRLDFLAESAAAGKGLDEVIHLFEPGMTHHDVEESIEDMPAMLDELGDDYPSPGDEPLGDEQLNGQGVEYEEDDVDAPGNSTDASLDEAAAASLVDSIGSIPHAVDDGPEETTLAPEAEDVVSANAELTTNNVSLQAVDLDTSEALEQRTGTIGGDENGNPDASAISTAQLTANDDLAPTTTTSTSSTVDGNETAPQSAVDEIAELEDGEATAQPHDDDANDLVEELDWREDGDEEEDDVLANDQTTPAKRARADDELGVDEENAAPFPNHCPEQIFYSGRNASPSHYFANPDPYAKTSRPNLSEISRTVPPWALRPNTSAGLGL